MQQPVNVDRDPQDPTFLFYGKESSFVSFAWFYTTELAVQTWEGAALLSWRSLILSWLLWLWLWPLSTTICLYQVKGIRALLPHLKRRHEWSEKGETKKPFSQQGFRQADSGGNSRKPLTNHSIVVIYLQGWTTDSSELALTLFSLSLSVLFLLLLLFSFILPSSPVLWQLLPVQNSMTDQCPILKSREKFILPSLWDSMLLSLSSLSNALPLHNLQPNKYALSFPHSLIKMKTEGLFFSFPHFFVVFLVMPATLVCGVWKWIWWTACLQLHPAQAPAGMGHMTDSS